MGCCLPLLFTQPLKSLTTKDGLSQGMIFDILKDSNGFMWFATKNGLNRYDGYTFRIFSHNPFNPLSISGDEITCLFEDSQNRFWVGTMGNGLNLFDRQREVFTKVEAQEASVFQLSIANIHSIDEDQQGRLWVGTSEGVFAITPRVENRSGQLSFHIDNKPIEAADIAGMLEVLCASSGTIYLSTALEGFFRYSEKEDRFVLIQGNAGEGLTSRGLFEYPNGNIWISQNDQLCLYQKEQKLRCIEKERHDTLSIIKDFALQEKTSRLWLVRGIYFPIHSIDPTLPIEEVSFSEEIDILESGYETKLFFDDNQTLWIGTNGYGIWKKSMAPRAFEHLCPGETVTFINQIGTQLFVGNQKMQVVDVSTDSAHLFSEQLLPKATLRGIYQAKDSTIWAISQPFKDGPKVIRLFRLNASLAIEAAYEVENVNPSYGKVQEDAQGNLWFPGDLVDFVKFDIQSGIATPFHIDSLGAFPEFNKNYFCFYKDQNGVFWKGSSSGLLRLELDKNGTPESVQVFQNMPDHRQSLSHNAVAACLDDPLQPDTYMWVGTKGGGLNKMHKKTGTFEHITTADGLPDNVVYGILTDEEQNLWLSTNRGLSHFNPEEGRFRNYRVEDGLQGDEFNTGGFYKGPDGRLYFGGINGLTAFYPKDIQPNQYKPPVYITSLKIHNKEWRVNSAEQEAENPLEQAIPYTETLDLAWQQNHITLEFAALDYTIPEKNLYQYRMRNVDKDWVNAGNQHSVTYANLNPGTYLFEVKGSNSNGIWNEQPRRLTIVIHPPWWRSTWAYLFYFLAIVGAIISLYRFQSRRIRLQRQLAYEQHEAERLAQMDRLKTNFFSNVTHEFRTPLTLIQEPLRQVIQEDLPAKGMEQAKQKLWLVQKSGQRLLELVNQLLDLVKLEDGNLKVDRRRSNIMEMILPIYQSFLPLAEKKSVELKLETASELPPCFIDKNKIEKVVANLLSNALKFTKGGRCTLAVSIEEKKGEDLLKIEVSDNGIGIPESEQHKVFDRFYQVDDSSTRAGEGTGIGLALTKELVELMGGQITLKSTSGQGTVFTVRLPLLTMEKSGNFTPAPADQYAQNAAIKEPYATSALAPSLAKGYLEAEQNGKLLLLLVEDNVELRHFIKQSLEPLFQIVEASNGQEGIQKGLELSPDLIISDLMMPQKDGFELTDRLKKDERTSHIPIILLTAKSNVESQLMGIKRGADIYLTKPFNFNILAAHIDNLIATRMQLQQKYLRQQTKPMGQRIQHFDQPENHFLQKLLRFVETQLDNPDLSAEELAQHMLMSRSQLHRKLKALTHQSTTEFVRNYRLDRAMQMLKNEESSISKIAYQVGFNNPKYFSTRFKEKFGKRPSDA